FRLAGPLIAAHVRMMPLLQLQYLPQMRCNVDSSLVLGRENTVARHGGKETAQLEHEYARRVLQDDPAGCVFLPVWYTNRIAPDWNRIRRIGDELVILRVLPLPFIDRVRGTQFVEWIDRPIAFIRFLRRVSL